MRRLRETMDDVKNRSRLLFSLFEDLCNLSRRIRLFLAYKCDQKNFLDLIYKLKEGKYSWRGRKKVQREKRKLVIPYSRPPLSP